MRLDFMIFGSGGLALAFVAGLAACTSGPTTAGPCGSSADCEDGQACNQGECVDAACLGSSECDIGQFCNPMYQCEEGCEADTDCVAGEVCDTESHQCQSYGCRDTNLDCDLGQYCDTTTGECYDADEGHCDSCDIYNTNSCGAQGTCYYFGGDECFSDADCPSGQACDLTTAFPDWGIPGFCHVDFCFMDCNPNADEPCPRGFSCIDATGLSEYICFADCQYLEENGY